MEPEKSSLTIDRVDKFENLKKITPLSKYLALALFIILPFIGGWIGYVNAPEKVVEVEKIVEIEKVIYEEQKEKEIISKVEYTNLDDMLEVAYYLEPYPKGLEGPSPYFFSNGSDLYSFNYPPMSVGGTFTKYSDIDIESLEYLGNSYYRDKNQILYNGYYSVSEGPTVLPYVDADTFAVVWKGKAHYVTDKDSVYYNGKKLDGIDPDSVTFIPVENYSLSIVRDADTVWLPQGNCASGSYRKGNLEEIPTYRSPCN